MSTYRMKYRPVGFATVPRDVRITFLRRPKGPGYDGLLHMPVSRHIFGVFETDRPLTPAEMRDFEVEGSEVE